MFALSILGLLMSEPLHGYEIRKQLSELLGLSGAISYGSLYPTLARLHGQGFVTSSTGEFQSKPVSTAPKQNIFSTGSLSGDMAFGSQSPFVRKSAISNPRKSKKVYTITEKGIQAFKSKLLSSFVDQANDDKAFVAHLAFLDLANESQKQIFFENRIIALTKRLNAIADTDHPTLKLWRDVEREFIENQISFLRSSAQELNGTTQ